MSEINDPEFLPVMESFYTIQGEGFYSGTPAYFVRLGGCDVGCVWCDVKESWDASKFEWFSVKQIADDAKQSGAKVVVVTGGEPLMYDLTKLTEELSRVNLQANIETSGAYPLWAIAFANCEHIVHERRASECRGLTWVRYCTRLRACA